MAIDFRYHFKTEFNIMCKDPQLLDQRRLKTKICYSVSFSGLPLPFCRNASGYSNSGQFTINLTGLDVLKDSLVSITTHLYFRSHLRPCGLRKLRVNSSLIISRSMILEYVTDRRVLPDIERSIYTSFKSSHVSVISFPLQVHFLPWKILG